MQTKTTYIELIFFLVKVELIFIKFTIGFLFYLDIIIIYRLPNLFLFISINNRLKKLQFPLGLSCTMILGVNSMLPLK